MSKEEDLLKYIPLKLKLEKELKEVNVKLMEIIGKDGLIEYKDPYFKNQDFKEWYKKDLEDLKKVNKILVVVFKNHIGEIATIEKRINYKLEQYEFNINKLLKDEIDFYAGFDKEVVKIEIIEEEIK